jgi:hypothetical protein
VAEDIGSFIEKCFGEVYNRIMERGRRICLDDFRHRFEMARGDFERGQGREEEMVRTECALIAARLVYGNGEDGGDRYEELVRFGEGAARINLGGLVEIICQFPEVLGFSEDELRVVLGRIYQLKPQLRSRADLLDHELRALAGLRGRNGHGE